MSSTVAQELWDQLCFLSDPTTRWLQRQPSRFDEACLVNRLLLRISDEGLVNRHMFRISDEAEKLLSDVICHEDIVEYFQFSAPTWNDRIAASRDEVLWVLREAYELAVWLGI